MKKASEYRQHAKECRALAHQAVSEEHRKQLSAMAEAWDTLAHEREKAAAKDEANLAAAGPCGSGTNGSGANGSGANGSGSGHASH